MARSGDRVQDDDNDDDGDDDGKTSSRGKAKNDDSGQFKMGTFTGVFIPTSLNIFSILMFLRFGFILGQVGVLGFVGMFLACPDMEEFKTD
jgi:potassium/chloride transporter 9